VEFRITDARVNLGMPALGTVLDLFGPHSHDLRVFDPVEVARIETDMWRSYYAHERVRLFGQMTTLLRTQYGFPPLRSGAAGLRAARAAVVFQRGHGRADYEKALPDLERFYGAIAASATTKFDVARAARLELEWWIVHREHKTRPPEDLYRALAALQAELYGMPAEAFAEHARERGDAMLLRDDAAERGGPSEAEWGTIGRMLGRSWESLRGAVGRGR